MYCARLNTADRFARFAQLRRARTCSATGSPYFWINLCFSDISGKMTFIFVFWQPFRGQDGVKYEAKNSSI